MGIVERMSRGVLDKLSAEEKPSLEETYKARRSIGLHPRDIARIYEGSRLESVRSFLSKHWYTFLPVAIVIFFVLWYVAWYYSGAPGSPTYPAGTRYGVIGAKYFGRKYMF